MFSLGGGGNLQIGVMQTWVHRGRNDTAANANANSDAPPKIR